MHDYLRAVGFSTIENRKSLDKILGIVMTRPSFIRTFYPKGRQKNVLVEKSYDFSERMGITVRGEYDEKGFFHLEHYFPYLTGRRVSAYENVLISKRTDTYAYTGTADDLHFGVSLMFYLQNVLDYMEEVEKGDGIRDTLPLTLSALSTEGKILLPIEKTIEQAKIQTEDNHYQSKLLNQAKNGDEEAINLLTMIDIDKYSMISRRLVSEDVYSIVDSSFMPYGSESDHFSLLGEIKEVTPHINSYTGETLTELIVSCNGIDFFIGINNADLLGEAKVGRRFKGVIWLQGMVDFS